MGWDGLWYSPVRPLLAAELSTRAQRLLDGAADVGHCLDVGACDHVKVGDRV